MSRPRTDTDEYLGGGLYFDTGIGDGTRLSTLLFASHSAPNEAPVNLDDEYDRERATLRYWHPLRQETTSSLSLSAAFDAEDLTINREGAEIRDDRLRVFEAGMRVVLAWNGRHAVFGEPAAAQGPRRPRCRPAGARSCRRSATRRLPADAVLGQHLSSLRHGLVDAPRRHGPVQRLRACPTANASRSAATGSGAASKLPKSPVTAASAARSSCAATC